MAVKGDSAFTPAKTCSDKWKAPSVSCDRFNAKQS